MLTVNIETVNAAFENAGRNAECARLLRELADTIENADTEDSGWLRDCNGNRVGTYQITDKR